MRRLLAVGAMALVLVAVAAPSPAATTLTRAQAIAKVRAMIAKNNRNPLCDKVTIKSISARAVRGRSGWWLVSTRVQIPAYSTPQAAAWVVNSKRIVAESQLAAELQSCPHSEQ